jgi:hypothetical protein
MLVSFRILRDLSAGRQEQPKMTSELILYGEASATELFAHRLNYRINHPAADSEPLPEKFDLCK